MKAEIGRRAVSFDYEVWLYDRTPEGTVIYNLDGSVRETVTGGETVAPSLIVPQQILEALVAEASDHLPPSSATERHLADARAVRDRILDAYLPKGGER